MTEQRQESVSQRTLGASVFPLVLCNVLVISAWLFLIASRSVAILGSALVVCPALLLVNYLVVAKSASRLTGQPAAMPRRISKVAWIGVWMFTISGLAAVYHAIAHPEMVSAIQAAIALLLAAFCWYIVFSFKRMGGPPRPC